MSLCKKTHIFMCLFITCLFLVVSASPLSAQNPKSPGALKEDATSPEFMPSEDVAAAHAAAERMIGLKNENEDDAERTKIGIDPWGKTVSEKDGRFIIKDAQGHTVKMERPDGETVTYGYDFNEAGEIIAVYLYIRNVVIKVDETGIEIRIEDDSRVPGEPADEYTYSFTDGNNTITLRMGGMNITLEITTSPEDSEGGEDKGTPIAGGDPGPGSPGLPTVPVPGVFSPQILRSYGMIDIEEIERAFEELKETRKVLQDKHAVETESAGATEELSDSSKREMNQALRKFYRRTSKALKRGKLSSTRLEGSDIEVIIKLPAKEE
ncbi:MAG: hypothetical protein ISS34_07690 [Candidatus Omnitrophica bacterium]|nr:hypothetical protein [Candidatus Omnitrophota bacterium]